MNFLITGDFYVSDSYQSHDLIDVPIKELFARSDYRIVNLETPLTVDEPGNRILKTGPHLQTSPNTILAYLKQLDVDTVSLANNHILDYGVTGLLQTFDSLQKNEISYVGAGGNLAEATEPLRLESEGINIAILNFAENEWSIANKSQPGANPLDIIGNVKQLQEAKESCDKVIAIIHGGNEYYHLPSPRMVKQYRFYAENGADAIIGHHTHCIGGYEVYRQVPIIYSLGNFLFTRPSTHECWYTGLLLNLSISKKAPISVELYPIRQRKNSFKVKLLSGSEKDYVLGEIDEYSKIIANTSLLDQHWEAFLVRNSIDILQKFSPLNLIDNRFIKALLTRLGVNKVLLRENYLKLLLNLVRCEAHADVSKVVLANFLDRH